MARKSIKGYAEKNYYDNTKFTGGVVASNDALNEGSFKHLVNFDISDTGQSLTPRKGFLATTFKYTKNGEEVEVALSENTVYFFNADAGHWIFIDFNNYTTSLYTFVGSDGNTYNELVYNPAVYKVYFDLENNFITNVEVIPTLQIFNLNIDPWKSCIGRSQRIIDPEAFKNTTPVSTNLAHTAIDEYSIPKHIIKMKHSDGTLCWFTFVYREYETEYEGIVYPANTLVLEYLDTEDLVNVVNTSQRNLASFSSIIPKEMQVVYEYGEEPLGFIQQFPMIYAKQNGKYLINTAQTVEDLEIIPYYSLRKTAEEGTYKWAYAYDITTTALDASLLDDTYVFRSSIYDLESNKVLLGYIYDENLTYSIYFNDIDDILGPKFENSPVVKSTYLINSHAPTFASWMYDAHKDYIRDLNFFKDKEHSRLYNKEYNLIIYMVPKYLGNTTALPNAFFEFKDNTINLLQTAWYNNSLYNPLIFTFDNIQDITNVETIDSHTYHEVYNNAVRNFSIHNHCAYKVINPDFTNTDTTDKLLRELEKYKDDFMFYVKPLNEVTLDYVDDHNKILENNKGFDSIIQTALYSNIIAFTSKGLEYEELKEYINSNTHFVDIYVKHFTNCAKIQTGESSISSIMLGNDGHFDALSKLLPGLLRKSSVYYVCFDSRRVFSDVTKEFNPDIWSGEYEARYNERDDSLFNLFNLFAPIDTIDDKVFYSESLSYLPCLDYWNLDHLHRVSLKDRFTMYSKEHFTRKENGILSMQVNPSDFPWNTFETGLHITFYLLQIPTLNYIQSINPTFDNYTREYFLATTSLIQSRIITLSPRPPVTYIEYLEEEPKLIQTSKEDFIFNSPLGDHLVTYNENRLFISKENMQYYFTEDYSFKFPETIVKAIQYKDMILVFTTQNLYAVYLTEYVQNVENGTDEEGNTKYVQQTTYVFAYLPVLYNLMVDARYKDAIQVYNQMVLFYSADGQMFLIKPTAAIDSNTRFSIQYFNKSVNDILLNYKDYMQQRLEMYGVNKLITDIDIKVITTINYIKVIYSAPGIMTYILIYDIINNRYYVYDTLLFSNVVNTIPAELGDVYVVKDNSKLYFTLSYNQPNDMDTNVDIAVYDNFYKNPVRAEIDTGTINLNNHLKKRFKDLHVIYKNINATELTFNLEALIDDVYSISTMNNCLEVKDLLGNNTIVVNQEVNNTEFLEENTALFNFMDYNSNKIITHKTNITNRGKTIRLKMHYTSKGKYKIQGFGLVYKEHTV